MKLNQVATANALAITTGVLFVVCRIAVSLFPDLMFAIAQSWFHGIELSKISVWNPSVSTFLLGLLSSVITVWLVGFTFVGIYNKLNKR